MSSSSISNLKGINPATTVPTLRDLLAGRNLSTDGYKNVLLARLQLALLGWTDSNDADIASVAGYFNTGTTKAELLGKCEKLGLHNHSSFTIAELRARLVVATMKGAAKTPKAAKATTPPTALNSYHQRKSIHTAAAAAADCHRPHTTTIGPNDYSSYNHSAPRMAAGQQQQEFTSSATSSTEEEEDDDDAASFVSTVSEIVPPKRGAKKVTFEDGSVTKFKSKSPLPATTTTTTPFRGTNIQSWLSELPQDDNDAVPQELINDAVEQVILAIRHARTKLEGDELTRLLTETVGRLHNIMMLL